MHGWIFWKSFHAVAYVIPHQIWHTIKLCRCHLWGQPWISWAKSQYVLCLWNTCTENYTFENVLLMNTFNIFPCSSGNVWRLLLLDFCFKQRKVSSHSSSRNSVCVCVVLLKIRYSKWSVIYRLSYKRKSAASEEWVPDNTSTYIQHWKENPLFAFDCKYRYIIYSCIEMIRRLSIKSTKKSEDSCCMYCTRGIG